MKSIFGTDGIRGRFKKEITYSLAFKVGYALGSNLEINNPIFNWKRYKDKWRYSGSSSNKRYKCKWQKIYKSWNMPYPSYPFFNQKRKNEWRNNDICQS